MMSRLVRDENTSKVTLWRCVVVAARSQPEQSSEQHCSSAVPREPSRIREESVDRRTGKLG